MLSTRMSQAREEHGSSAADDLAFVRRILRGRRDELATLAERLRCVPRMLLFLDQRSGNLLGRDALADLSQDVAVLVWRKLEEFEGLSTLEGWVHGFCVREYWNAIRRVHRQRHEVRAVVLHGRGEVDRVSDPDPWAFEELYDGLRRIGREEADVIRLKHFEGRTFEEISTALGIPANTAKTRYYRGLCELRSVLGSMEEER